MNKLLLMALLASLVVSSIVGVIIFLIGDFEGIQRKVLLTTLTAGVFSFTVLACSNRPVNWGFWPVPYLAKATSLIAAAAVIAQIWGRPDVQRISNLVGYQDSDWRLAAALVILAVSMAHLSILAAFQPSNNLIGYCLGASMLIVVAMSALLITGILERFDLDRQGFYFRLLGVVAVLDVLGTASLVILSRLAVFPESASARSRTRVGHGR